MKPSSQALLRSAAPTLRTKCRTSCLGVPDPRIAFGSDVALVVFEGEDLAGEQNDLRAEELHVGGLHEPGARFVALGKEHGGVHGHQGASVRKHTLAEGAACVDLEDPPGHRPSLPMSMLSV